MAILTSDVLIPLSHRQRGIHIYCNFCICFCIDTDFIPDFSVSAKARCGEHVNFKHLAPRFDSLDP